MQSLLKLNSRLSMYYIFLVFYRQFIVRFVNVSKAFYMSAFNFNRSYWHRQTTNFLWFYTVAVRSVGKSTVKKKVTHSYNIFDNNEGSEGC